MDYNYNLVLSESLLNHIKTAKFLFYGELYGFQVEDKMYVMGYTIRSDGGKSENKYEKYSRISENNLPAPFNMIGVVYCEPEHVSEHIKQDFTDTSSSQNPIIKKYVKMPKSVIIGIEYVHITVSAFLYENGILTSTTYDTIKENEFWSMFGVVRLHANFNLPCDNPSDEFIKSFVSDRISEISNEVAVYSFDKDISLSNAKEHENVFWKNLVPTVELKGHLSKFNIKESVYNIIWVYLKTDMSHCKMDGDNESVCRCCTYGNIHCNYERSLKNPEEHRSMIIESVLLHDKRKGLNEMYPTLISATLRSLWLIIEYYGQNTMPPQFFQYFVPELCYFVTLLYPTNVLDKDLVPLREFYHWTFHLPCDKPVFTRGKSLEFRQDMERFGLLKNVHIGLKPPTKDPDEISLVKGSYIYYHYRQLGVLDDGWGCAYRSLQTIFSWYKCQGWTKDPVPTHLEIQETLVKIGDKQRSFVMSKTWIGSLEVSYVLDSMLDVSSRLLTVQKGESIATYAHEISNHFEKQGTPIMIGGGVLAHTIIGIYIDEETDDVRILILDPHYIGHDDVPSIQNKGGVAWKKPDFWKKNTFYNLCLPFKKTGF